ncbi:DNA topoisomerase IB [Marivirga sp. S37H4]|uniref:DNA topoisomerase n=1 Tax=Marivirga aurantiaca TaxID=2802615 RepID=A0A934WZ18_9BACT|nr:DNA topoisomerase IB [Marivirga aurantiaca]
MKLKKIDDSSLVIERKRRGRGFAYFDASGKKISSPEQLRRLKKIVIPPMWSEVKICELDEGHIQAIGRDAKGRKQYIYHSEWERRQQEMKFSRMIEFGKLLPKVRKQCEKDLGKRGWKREKVIALMVSLLDEYGIRVGNSYYAKQNQSYGLTTLRKKHLKSDGRKLQFNFNGKSGQEQSVTIEDDALVKHIQKAVELPGYEIFRYMDDAGKTRTVDSQEVNEYIYNILGDDFSSKDFRTWAGSRLALELYPVAVEQKETSSRKKIENILIRLVADELGNTPSVCRTYYVHPKIAERIETGSVPVRNPYKDSSLSYGLTAEEKLLLSLLEE